MFFQQRYVRHVFLLYECIENNLFAIKMSYTWFFYKNPVKIIFTVRIYYRFFFAAIPGR